MPVRLYSSIHADVAEMWRITTEETMQDAAKKEIDAAVSRGDVNDGGIAMIPVEADACWSKRSYKTNYSALSGVAAIIGEHTGKVLHIGVRNKYCVICARAYKKGLTPRVHDCHKNHSGSSTSMEQSILVEGFKVSIAERNLIYNTLIADGDSSTYKNILESRPYPNVSFHDIDAVSIRLRRCILTASMFSKICKRRPNTDSAPLVKTLLYSYNLNHVPAIKTWKRERVKSFSPTLWSNGYTDRKVWPIYKYRTFLFRSYT